MKRLPRFFCLLLLFATVATGAFCQRAAKCPGGAAGPRSDAASALIPPGNEARPRVQARPHPSPEPGVTSAPGTPASAPERPPASKDGAFASALDLPDAEGVTRLTSATAAAAPLVGVPAGRVVAQARKHCRTHFYGLYLQGKKLGWGEVGCGLGRWKGQEVLERRSHLVMEAKMYATKVRIEVRSTARFAVIGRGELVSYEYLQDSGQQRKTLSIERGTGGWVAEQTYRAGTITKPPTRKTLPDLRSSLSTGEMAVTTLLLEGRLSPGSRLRYVELDPEDVVERESAMQILASGERVLQGVRTGLTKQEALDMHRKLHGVSLVDPSGHLLDGTLQGSIRIRREEMATAKRIDAKAGDFGLGAVIRAPLGVKDPGKVSQLRLRLEGYLPESLKESPRHLLRRLGSGAAELTITRESLLDLPATPLPQPGGRFEKELAATDQIESGHPEILRLARRAAGGERRALPAARMITAFVFEYLTKSLSTNLDSALAIARAKVGDCTEHARLMVALCRAIGLPAREVGGVTWVPDLGGFGYHAWVEVWVGRWVSADPSWNEVPANATHIHMGGPDDVRWIGTLGNLKISVLDVRKEEAKAAPAGR